jgi:DHA1 family multidrug resistance protein-like MFS transporter
VSTRSYDYFLRVSLDWLLCFSLFGRAFFRNLGLGPGSAVLAGISFFLIAVYWVCLDCLRCLLCPDLVVFSLQLLFRYAHVLRKRSKYAVST